MPADGGSQRSSIEALRARLEQERLRAIMAVAGAGEADSESVARIGHLHLALLAVRDEIDAHAPKLGTGSEAPLP